MWSVWLVFCDYGFHSIFPLRDKNNRLMEASWWERLTGGKLGLVLMGRTMLGKSLIQFSVDRPGYVIWPERPNYGGSTEDNGSSFKRSCARTAILSTPNAVAGHRQPMPPPETPEHSQASLGQSLVGSTATLSWVLVSTRFCLCPPRVCFPSPVEVP